MLQVANPLSEKEHYAAFVDRTLMELKSGLLIDDTATNARMAKVVQTLDGLNLDAAKRVLCSRFALGADDTVYLASGLAVLWSTVATSEGDELALAPEVLYSPDAVGGIRRGLLRALEAKNADLQSGGSENLRLTLRSLNGMLNLPQFGPLTTSSDIMEALANPDQPLTATQVKTLAKSLATLKALLQPVAGDLLEQILTKVSLTTRLVKAREALSMAKERAKSTERVYSGAIQEQEEQEKAFDKAQEGWEQAKHEMEQEKTKMETKFDTL